MSLFKFRNLALACFGFLIALYLSFNASTTLRLSVLLCAIFTIFILLVLFIITRRKAFKDSILRYSPLCILIALAMIFSFTVFDRTKEKAILCDENEHIIVAKVDRVIKSTKYSGEYEIDISSIDDENEKLHLALFDDKGTLLDNDIICARVVFERELARDLGNGISFGARAVEYISVEAGKPDPVDHFRNANKFLDSLFKDSLNDEAYALMSAMFLGNRERLDESTNRDFARVGLVHILSLSGMHVSIFMAIVCFFISRLHAPRAVRVLLTAIIIFVFIAINGFQKTALRAGLMQLFFFTSFYIWERPDSVSSLFVSVFLICLFDPYAVFSLSLLLSFLAMLGCICTGYVMKKSKLSLKCRTRLARFCLLTLGSTIFVTAMTIPFIAIKFKQISLFSFLSNLIIAPVLNILIYIAPLMLLVAKIPFVSEALAFVCEGITYISTNACRWLASFEHSVIPINTKWQLLGAFIVFTSAWLFIILSKKHTRAASFCAILGFLFIFTSTSLLYIERANNEYISVSSASSGDAVFIESNNSLTIIEASSHELSSSLAYIGQLTLGYTEIDNLVLCDYNHRLPAYIDSVTSSTIVRRIYLQDPCNEKEIELHNEIIPILEARGVKLEYIKSSTKVDNIEISFCQSSYNASSTKRSVAYSAIINNVRFTYLGASSYELVDYFPSDYANASDYVVFGSYGPTYKIEYDYELKCLDYCTFLGNSKEFAGFKAQEACANKEISEGTKIHIPH